MSDPVETLELIAFTKTVDAKSVSRAAAELRVPRATLSRRLARLEERLDTRLLRRTTRSLALTDSGQAFYQQARIVLDAVTNAEASVRRTDDLIRGDLRVSVPPIKTRSFFDMVARFAAKYPGVRLHMHFSNEFLDLRRSGYDVAIRASSELEPGLIARTLARVVLLAVASPTYLAEMGVPRSTKDLRDHRCLMGFAQGELAQTHWPLIGGGKLHVDGSFFSNDISLLCDAAVRGAGIAMLPGMVARPFLESGDLVPVLPGELQGDGRIAVVHLEREFVPPQVRAFVEAVVAWAPGELDPPLPPECREELARRSAARKATAPAAPPRKAKAKRRTKGRK